MNKLATLDEGAALDPSKRERDETYHGVILTKGNWRVIICKDGLQWILQKRAKEVAQSRWRGDSYSQTRKALTRLWHAKTGDYHGACHLSQTLPERIGGADGH